LGAVAVLVEIPICSGILAASSSYFHKLFSTTMREAEEKDRAIEICMGADGKFPRLKL
jgi:hypothetical protein